MASQDWSLSPSYPVGGLPAPAAQQLATEVASGTLTTLPSNESATGAPPVAASTLAPPQLRKPILPPGIDHTMHGTAYSAQGQLVARLMLCLFSSSLTCCL